MSQLDFRNIETVDLDGIPVTTFLSDDKEVIMVSITDLMDGLGLRVDPEGFNVGAFTVYDALSRPNEHLCIPHTEVNDYLYAGFNKRPEDLVAFRAQFLVDVALKWARLSGSQSQLTIKESAVAMRSGAFDYSKRIDLPYGRVRGYLLDLLGKNASSRLSPLEEVFMSSSEVLYLAMVDSLLEDNEEPMEAASMAEDTLEPSFRELIRVTKLGRYA